MMKSLTLPMHSIDEQASYMDKPSKAELPTLLAS
jgi:hypothetical protein